MLIVDTEKMFEAQDLVNKELRYHYSGQHSCGCRLNKDSIQMYLISGYDSDGTDICVSISGDGTITSLLGWSGVKTLGYGIEHLNKLLKERHKNWPSIK